MDITDKDCKKSPNQQRIRIKIKKINPKPKTKRKRKRKRNTDTEQNIVNDLVDEFSKCSISKKKKKKNDSSSQSMSIKDQNHIDGYGEGYGYSDGRNGHDDIDEKGLNELMKALSISPGDDVRNLFSPASEKDMNYRIKTIIQEAFQNGGMQFTGLSVRKRDIYNSIQQRVQAGKKAKKAGEYKIQIRPDFDHNPVNPVDNCKKRYFAVMLMISKKEWYRSTAEIIKEINPNLYMNDTSTNPLLKFDIMIDSILLGKGYRMVFFPTSILEKDADSKYMDGSSTGGGRYDFGKIDRDEILRIFRKIFNIKTKKIQNIFDFWHINYSPNTTVLFVFVKNEYKLKDDANWVWKRQWAMFNDWVPNERDFGYHRGNNPYRYILTSDANRHCDWNIRYRIVHNPETGEWVEGGLPFKITQRFIYEQLCIFHEKITTT